MSGDNFHCPNCEAEGSLDWKLTCCEFKCSECGERFTMSDLHKEGVISSKEGSLGDAVSLKSLMRDFGSVKIEYIFPRLQKKTLFPRLEMKEFFVRFDHKPYGD